MQGTPFAIPASRFDGAILFWEEVRRPLSWLWNDLHALRLAGVLDRIAAMIVGVPTELPFDDAGEVRYGLLREGVVGTAPACMSPVLAVNLARRPASR